MSGWIDISVPLRNGMTVWQGDPPAQFTQSVAVDSNGEWNITRMNISAHTGTHMDAPRHVLRDGESIDMIPLDAVLGPARVVEVVDPVSVKPGDLPGDLKRGDRLLFKTVNSERCWGRDEFVEDFVYISKEAAEVIVKAGVQTVGIDYLSVGGLYQDLMETHVTLLGGGVWVIEGLNLSGVAPGWYELACLPLKIVGADGAPARAAIRALSAT